MTVPAQVFPELSAAQQERLAYGRAQARRSRVLAGASTVVFLAVMGAVVVLSPGWERVKEQFLDPQVAKDSFPAILEGFWLNLRVLAVCAVLIVVVGLGVAATRTLRGPVFAPLRFLAAVYTDVFRGFPLIVLLYIIGFGVPGLRLQGVPTSPVVLGGVALVLTYSAYVAEVFRAGIETVGTASRMKRSPATRYGVKSYVRATSIWAARTASTAPRTEIRPTSFCSATKSLSSGGVTRRTACGSTTRRIDCP